MPKISGIIKNYDWGKLNRFSLLIENKESNLPEAELWFGTHPLGISKVVDTGELLTDYFQKDNLYDKNFELPFLVKFLSVEKPLSIQVHPNKKNALNGFNKENAKNIPLDSLHRNYKDSNHKPELIIALSEFQLFYGLKNNIEIFRIFKKFQIESFFRSLENKLIFSKKKLIEEILSLDLKKLKQIQEILFKNNKQAFIKRSKFYDIYKVYRSYPQDPSIILLLIMNHSVLKKNEIKFIDSGVPHVYISGFGLEIMANSDNVLRGGITSKKVDIYEFVNNIEYFKSAISKLQKHKLNKKNFKEFVIKKLEKVENKENYTILETNPIMIIVSEGEITISGKNLKKGNAFWSDQNVSSRLNFTSRGEFELYYVVLTV